MIDLEKVRGTSRLRELTPKEQTKVLAQLGALFLSSNYARDYFFTEEFVQHSRVTSFVKFDEVTGTYVLSRRPL